MQAFVDHVNSLPLSLEQKTELILAAQTMAIDMVHEELVILIEKYQPKLEAIKAIGEENV